MVLPSPPPLRLDEIVLFLDVDGTLLEFAARPDAVVVTPTLRSMLRRLHKLLNGALVPISGRTLRDIDSLLRLPAGAAAGVHGAQLRDMMGTMLSAPSSPFHAARTAARRFEHTIPGLLVEDKGMAIALHFRSAPDSAVNVRHAASEILEHAGSDFEILEGSRVIEIKPRADKGEALLTLMQLPEFVGRIPWMIGDDATDEDAFVSANAIGGVSVVVGHRRPTAARYGLDSPTAVASWMSSILDERDLQTQ